MVNVEAKGIGSIVVVLVLIGWLAVGFIAGSVVQRDEISRLRSDRDELHAIADMREALFQQDERKLDAVSWCLTSSPTPTACAAYALRATR